MKKRRNSGHNRYLFVWGVVSVLVVGCLMVTMQSNHASETEGGKVTLASKAKIESPGIPPIDEAVPSLIETASFGLG
ncbi:MAG: hypothetical protein HKP41_04340 [Desulfobacterales bacterium]|nr:hypothetical protein [Desulfobacterales bacterium]